MQHEVYTTGNPEEIRIVLPSTALQNSREKSVTLESECLLCTSGLTSHNTRSTQYTLR